MTANSPGENRAFRKNLFAPTFSNDRTNKLKTTLKNSEIVVGSPEYRTNSICAFQ